MNTHSPGSYRRFGTISRTPFSFSIYGMSVLVMGFVVAMVYFLTIATFGNEWDFGVGSAFPAVESSGELCGYPAREPDLGLGYVWNLLLWPFIFTLGFFAERLISGAHMRQVQASASGSL